MKTFVNFVVISIIACSCAPLRTHTIFKSSNSPTIRSIGYNKLDGDNILVTIYSKMNDIFDSTISKTFESYCILDYVKLNLDLTYENFDRERIQKICSDLNLDAILLTHLKFLNLSYSINFIPIGGNFDTDVSMKLFDRNGYLLLDVSHNTLRGNSYWNYPTPDRTIKDGINGALKRIFKEIGVQGIKKNGC